MTAQDNIRSLYMALTNLSHAIVKSGATFTLEGAGAVSQALTQTYAALEAHQEWLLSDRK